MGGLHLAIIFSTVVGIVAFLLFYYYYKDGSSSSCSKDEGGGTSCPGESRTAILRVTQDGKLALTESTDAREAFVRTGFDGTGDQVYHIDHNIDNNMLTPMTAEILVNLYESLPDDFPETECSERTTATVYDYYDCRTQDLKRVGAVFVNLLSGTGDVQENNRQLVRDALAETLGVDASEVCKYDPETGRFYIDLYYMLKPHIAGVIMAAFPWLASNGFGRSGAPPNSRVDMIVSGESANMAFNMALALILANSGSGFIRSVFSGITFDDDTITAASTNIMESNMSPLLVSYFNDWFCKLITESTAPESTDDTCIAHEMLTNMCAQDVDFYEAFVNSTDEELGAIFESYLLDEEDTECTLLSAEESAGESA